jgi:mannose-1-phosphate guanylyltransferase
VDAGTPATLLAANLAYAPLGRAGDEVVGSVVGEDVEIGEGARVERSLIMEGVVIGPGAVVTDSIVGPKARIGAGARLGGGSVIGERYVVDAGADLSGARLPQTA